MHRGTNECRTVHSGAVNRLAFDRNTHDPADRQSHHARTHDRQPHHARAHDRQPHDVRADDWEPHDGRADDREPHDTHSNIPEPHDARSHDPTSDGSADDADRAPDAAAILRPELRAEPAALC